MSYRKVDAINFLKQNGAVAASNEYSDVQILALLKMIVAKDTVGIAEDVKKSTGVNPSFWTFLEEINFTPECRGRYPELPESLARFCQHACQGDMKIAIDTIETLVYDSMDAGYFDSEYHFKILSSFMKDMKCIVNLNKERQERTLKNIKKREVTPSQDCESNKNIYIRANSLSAKLKNQSNVILYQKLVPDVGLAIDRDILNGCFCRLCHRPIESISPSPRVKARDAGTKARDDVGKKLSNHFCSKHYPETRTGRDLINKVFNKVVDSHSRNSLLKSKVYPHINFSNEFPIFELSLKEPDLSIKSILLFKWANRLEYVVMLKREVEKIVFAEGNADISDVWDDNNISNFRDIYLLLAKDKCFPKFGDVKEFDFYVENNRIPEAMEKFFGLNKALNPLICYNSMVRYLSYRMIEIVSKIRV